MKAVSNQGNAKKYLNHFKTNYPILESNLLKEAFPVETTIWNYT